VSGRRAIWLTVRREVGEGLRARAFRISLAIQVVLVAGIAVASALTGGDDGPEKRTVATVGQQARQVAQTARSAQDRFQLRLRVKAVPDAAAARREVRDGDVDAALAPGRLITQTEGDDTLAALLQQSARTLQSRTALRRAGLSPRQIAAALDPPPLRAVEVAPPGGAGGKGLAYIGALVLYIAIIMFSFGIAAGVVAEKSSRVVELVLSAIRPAQLLAGKVIGVGVVGLLQVVTVAAVGLGVSLIAGRVDLPDSTAKTALLVALYFVLGYAFYGCACAGAASIVSRQEDSQNATSPMLVLLVGSYILSTSALGNASGSLAQICTFLPPVAPMVVPGRAAQDALPGWELGASVALMVLGTLLVIRVAGRVYERSVLHFGSPLKLTEALRQSRSPRPEARS